jgi:hypothetical protein
MTTTTDFTKQERDLLIAVALDNQQERYEITAHCVFFHVYRAIMMMYTSQKSDSLSR